MNTITIAGYIAQEPKLPSTTSGTPVLNFRVPVDNPFRENDTEWFSVAVFGKRADSLNAILSKGSFVVVSGRLSSSPYSDNSGNCRPGLKINADQVTLGPKNKPKREPEPEPDFEDPFPF